MNQIGKFLSIDFSDSASILTSSGVFAGLLIIFAMSCAAVWVLVRQAGRMDVPNQRSMHTISTPTGAGIVMVLVLLLGSSYLFVNLASIQFLIITVVLAMLAFIGWRDDKNYLSVGSRMTMFVVFSLPIILFIGVIDQISFGDLGSLYLPFPIAAILTLVGFIWLLNLYNFMDGMDGLAAMQTIIASAGFLVLSVDVAFFSNSFFDALTYSSAIALLCGILFAATLGFLVWNWSPAKIFMGDVGSLPIGGFFAICCIMAVRELEVSALSCILILGVFIFDASYTLVARLMRGEKVTEAHRSHIYQRLAATGVPHSRIVLVYSVKMLLATTAAISWEIGLINGFVTGLVAFISVVFGLIWVQWLERSQ